MNLSQLAVSYAGLTRKEVDRFVRVWTQSLVPPILNSMLYFLIFGHVIGSRIGLVEGVPYIQYITPGLMLMAVVLNSYNNVSFSFYMSKFNGSIQDILVSPMPNIVIIAGFVTAGMLRGLIVALIVLLIGYLFSPFTIHFPVELLLVLLLVALLFSCGGLLNAVFAKSFDDTAMAATFILSPLIYLGGVFYNIHELQGVWYYLSMLNPIHYIVALLRHCTLGITQVPVITCFSVLLIFIVMVFSTCLYVMNRGIRIKA